MHADVHGFPLPAEMPFETYQVQRQALDGLESEQVSRWARLWPIGLPAVSGRTLKQAIRKGIPPSRRAEAWARYSGANALRAQYPTGYYRDLASQVLASRMFELEVGQTFVSNGEFAALLVASSEGRMMPVRFALARILLAYAKHYGLPAIPGSLNVVASGLLLVLEQEEGVFWLLLAHTTAFHRGDPSIGTIRGRACLAEQDVLWALLENKEPKLTRHLRSSTIDSLHAFTASWTASLFIDCLPFSTALRVLDAYFHEGPKILLRVSLALFKLHKDKLMQLREPTELQQAIKAMPSLYYDQQLLMRTAFDGIGGMSGSWIDGLRFKSLNRLDTVIRPMMDDGSLPILYGEDEDEIPMNNNTHVSRPAMIHLPADHSRYGAFPLSVSPPRYKRPPCQLNPTALCSLAEEDTVEYN